MAEPFLGEIKLIGFHFAPRGWAFCNGQILPIAQNQALFALLGINFGGDGRTTFALPDLRDRAPVHAGMGLSLAQFGGQAAHVLTMSESQHVHGIKASANQATTGIPTGNALAAKRRGGQNTYAPGPAVALDELSITTQPGGGQPHENRQPYLVLNFIICTVGIFPSRD